MARLIPTTSPHKSNFGSEMPHLQAAGEPPKPEARRRLLLVAYNFPPVGGAGVQRPVKWVKFLPSLGWDVTVLTVENPSVPARDESLLADIPDSTVIVKALTREPSYAAKQSFSSSESVSKQGWIGRFKGVLRKLVKSAANLVLQPDVQVLWVPEAIKAGRRTLQSQSHDAILVTAPPYSSFFLGRTLAREFGIPLILDFRDEWDNSTRYLENASRNPISRFVQERMQRGLLKSADAVVATTQPSTQSLKQRIDQVQGRAVTACIYNGYDEHDLHSTSEPAGSSEKKFRLVYTGTLWNLTTIEPLVAAIEELARTDASLLKILELTCIGRQTPEQSAILDRLKGLPCRLVSQGYSPHTEVVQAQCQADALCLLLADVPGGERVIPGKLFEYLATGREMLSITPLGETSEIASRFHPEGHFVPSNVTGIAQWLRRRLESVDRGDVRPRSLTTPDGVEEYSRLSQSKKLVQLLNQVSCPKREVRR